MEEVSRLEGGETLAHQLGVMLLGGSDSFRTTGKEDETTEVLTNSGDTTPGFKLIFRTR